MYIDNLELKLVFGIAINSRNEQKSGTLKKHDSVGQNSNIGITV